MANEIAKLSSFTLAKLTVDNLKEEIHWKAHGRIRERYLYENPRLTLKLVSDSTDWYKDKEWYIDINGDETFRFYQDGFIDTLLRYDREQNINGWHFILHKKPETIGHNTYSFIVYDPITLAKYYKNKIQINYIPFNEKTVIML